MLLRSIKNYLEGELKYLLSKAKKDNKKVPPVLFVELQGLNDYIPEQLAVLLDNFPFQPCQNVGEKLWHATVKLVQSFNEDLSKIQICFIDDLLLSADKAISLLQISDKVNIHQEREELMISLWKKHGHDVEEYNSFKQEVFNKEKNQALQDKSLYLQMDEDSDLSPRIESMPPTKTDSWWVLDTNAISFGERQFNRELRSPKIGNRQNPLKSQNHPDQNLQKSRSPQKSYLRNQYQMGHF